VSSTSPKPVLAIDRTNAHRAPHADRPDAPGHARAEAIDQLAGTLAHEFSNLLTAMTGRLELLLDRRSMASAERQLLLEIKAGADAAGRITRQLLAISGRQTMAPESEDLNSIVQDTADLLQLIGGDAAEIRFDLAGSVPLVTIDAQLIRQVLLGLITTARAQGAGAGRITIYTVVEADLLGPSVRLTVVDSRPWPGCDLDQIFEPKPSVGRQPRGAGLTLAAIRGTVRQCGAMIVCEPAEPTGVAFHIRFPLSAG
jgi:signal transduction histidine kinase